MEKQDNAINYTVILFPNSAAIDINFRKLASYAYNFQTL